MEQIEFDVISAPPCRWHPEYSGIYFVLLPCGGHNYICAVCASTWEARLQLPETTAACDGVHGHPGKPRHWPLCLVTVRGLN